MDRDIRRTGWLGAPPATHIYGETVVGKAVFDPREAPPDQEFCKSYAPPASVLAVILAAALLPAAMIAIFAWFRWVSGAC
ncbi:hypothetical protein [Reyranella sp.]|jgi:hypothetical protein|uniref:hypothetical protein n=1 Tax=Reyranella sp. TaxID=1929291 RepID=UPI000BD84A45|nr:hypothetical protein [Reyranella sp.]OYY35585.1 MAG: hypothetical protein B7Y57_25740 [Rhodospirillales bacterium 35-66-84]OYZ91455.1 MAG: hypothetical protein B7Y08_25610 [Rhodospirillales bacterium 24-66-33]OZB21992.1 MAG: hypothetical protein B7X63_24535 [Rhodospirillales bacterium 39-66-50]HQS14991.1 hypothetical protein [Reyranella sp.]HQT10800.1 hypothetical protein [Reyranella sp.]